MEVEVIIGISVVLGFLFIVLGLIFRSKKKGKLKGIDGEDEDEIGTGFEGDDSDSGGDGDSSSCSGCSSCSSCSSCG